MINVYAVALAAIAASSMVIKRASWSLAIRKSSMLHRQKSKLIIFFITKMPREIYIAEPTSIS
jgi:hypothetical protein